MARAKPGKLSKTEKGSEADTASTDAFRSLIDSLTSNISEYPYVVLQNFRKNAEQFVAAGPKLFDAVRDRLTKTYDSQELVLDRLSGTYEKLMTYESHIFWLKALLYISSPDLATCEYKNNSFTFVGINLESDDPLEFDFDPAYEHIKCIDIDKIIISKFDFNKYSSYEDFLNAIPKVFGPIKAELSLLESEITAVERSPILDSLLETVPRKARYEEQADAFERLKHDFNEKFAVSFLGTLRAEMAKKPHSTYEEKKQLIRWTNVELKRFNLAIKSPKTGLPSKLLPQPGNNPELGAFQLIGEDAEGKDRTYTTPDLSTLLGILELTDAPPRKEGVAEWNEKVRRGRGNPRRGG